MSGLEIEQKYKIKNPEVFRQRLKKLCARKISSGKEYNFLFDRGGSLKKKGAVLRLRRGANILTALTYKGARLKSRYKKRREVYLRVSDFKQTVILLQLIGFKKSIAYSKYREAYRMKQVLVTLDRIPKYGWYLEIEGRAKDILKTQRVLELSERDKEDKTYLEILNPPVKS